MKGKQNKSQISISSETALNSRLLPSSSSSLFSLSSSGKSVIANLAAASSSLISSTVSPTVAVHPLPETLKRAKSSKKVHHHVAPVDIKCEDESGGVTTGNCGDESIYCANQVTQANEYSTISTNKSTNATSLTHVTPLYTCNNVKSHLIIPQSELGTFRTLLSGWETVTAGPPAASSSSLNTNYESSSLRSSSSLGVINTRSSALANREFFLYGTPSSCETSPMSFNYPPYCYTVPPTFQPVTVPSESVTSTSSSYRHASVDRLNSRKNIYERGANTRIASIFDSDASPAEAKSSSFIAYSLQVPTVDQFATSPYRAQRMNTGPTVVVDVPTNSSSESTQSNLYTVNQFQTVDSERSRDKYINPTSKASFTSLTPSHLKSGEKLFNTRADVFSSPLKSVNGCEVFSTRRKSDENDKQVDEGGDNTSDALVNQNNEIELHMSGKSYQPSAGFTTFSLFTPSVKYQLQSTVAADGEESRMGGGRHCNAAAGGEASSEQIKLPKETYGKFKVSSVTINPQSNIESSPLPSTLFTSLPNSVGTINPCNTAASGDAMRHAITNRGESNCPQKTTFTDDKHPTRNSVPAAESSANESHSHEHSRQAKYNDDFNRTYPSSARKSSTLRDDNDRSPLNCEHVIGFAQYPVQVYKKIVKKGFKYNVMIVGESGTGKSTGVNCLFHSDIYSTDYPGPSSRASGGSTVTVESTRVILLENNVKIDLTVTDTPGFACALNNNDCFVPIVQFIDDKYREFFDYECSIYRSHITDNRVHVLLYFIAPSGHSLKQLDLEVMKQLSGKVNIIPIISKADAFTTDELIRFKSNIRNDLDVNRIQYVKFFKCACGCIHCPMLNGSECLCCCEKRGDSENDHQSTRCQMEPIVPFALIGSNYIHHNPASGECTRLRKYPWGSVQVENTQHSDFLVLRNILLKDHLLNLVNYTNDTLYESYRISQLKILQSDETRVNGESEVTEWP